jgi:hypothetical protein
MKAKTSLIVLAILVGGLIVSAETRSDYDKEFDFAQLKTFDFKRQSRSVKDPLGTNELWNRRIHDDLVTQLTLQGFDHVKNRYPDFLVAYYMGTKEKEDVRYLGYGYPGGGRRWRRWGWAGWPREHDVWSIPYTESTLVVDIIDAESNQMVWRGYDTENIDINKADKTISKGVENLIKRFVKETRGKSK